MKADFVLGLTGASGAIYALRLLDVLCAGGARVQLSISPAGQQVLEQELGLAVDLDNFSLESLLGRELPGGQRGSAGSQRWLLGEVLGGRAKEAGARRQSPDVRYHHYRDLLAPIASGSSLTAGMIVCPCSGGTLSAIAHGASTNLIHRAADVHLKEGRKLVLVPREAPLSLVMLENMRRCVEAGAVVLPAMPGFYHGVESVRDLIDFVVARICDQLGFEHRLVRRWGE
ncbi:MAG: flavin prenyltransferase UbiX [Pirellulales bacterium]